MIRLFTLFALIFALYSCKDSTCDWKGGEITDYGTYCSGDNGLKIEVYKEGNSLRYAVRNKNEDVVIMQDRNISTLHHWGLFLDTDENLWVFSSDVGTGIWEKDSVTGEYSKRMFHHKVARDSVPKELYESSLKRFLK